MIRCELEISEDFDMGYESLRIKILIIYLTKHV